MKKVVVIGHFAFGIDKYNGQTVKTKVIAAELQYVFGRDEVGMEDTMGGVRFLLRLPLVLIRMLFRYHNIVFLPAYKGVRIIVPLLVVLNFFFRRKLHYVVIGGWLPEYVRKYPLLRWALARLDGIYVETLLMKQEIGQSATFCNLYVMPNCKKLDIVNGNDFHPMEAPPFKLCTFSRVMKEKGIGDAVEAVEACNKQAGKTLFTLDIYGPIEEQKWFEHLVAGRQNVNYCGVVPYSQSIHILKSYFALLFPTYYHGEGFAGTIIDALSAGLPTIASDWKANNEIIENGKTGLLFTPQSVEALTDTLNTVANRPEAIYAMRKNCIAEAKNYQPEVVLKILTDRIH